MNGLEEVSSGEVVVNNLVLNHKNKIEFAENIVQWFSAF